MWRRSGTRETFSLSDLMNDKIIHLRDDHDNIGESIAWCDTMNPSCVDRPETVTCRECLEKIVVFAADCAKRLGEL